VIVNDVRFIHANQLTGSLPQQWSALTGMNGM
jgi:hypothetical protein